MYKRQDIHFVEEAALGTGMAGRAILDHLHHQCVLVAVCGDGHHMLEMCIRDRVCMVPTTWQQIGVTYTPTFVSGKTLNFTINASDLTKA